MLSQPKTRTSIARVDSGEIVAQNPMSARLGRRHDRRREHLADLSKLTHYFNSYTTITDRTPELRSHVDSLERITFDACHGLTDTGIAALARLPRLTKLRVSGRGVSPDVRWRFPRRSQSTSAAERAAGLRAPRNPLPCDTETIGFADD